MISTLTELRKTLQIVDDSTDWNSLSNEQDMLIPVIEIHSSVRKAIQKIDKLVGKITDCQGRI